MKLAILLLFTISTICSAEVFRISRVLSKQSKETAVMTLKKDDVEEKLFVEKRPIVSSADVVEAYAQMRPEGGIFIRLSAAAAERMFKATKNMKHGKDRMAMIIDGKVIHAPVVQSSIGASFEVTGFDKLGYNERAAIARRIKPPKK